MSFLLLLRAALPMQINKNDMQSALRFLEKEITFFSPSFVYYLSPRRNRSRKRKKKRVSASEFKVGAQKMDKATKWAGC